MTGVREKGAGQEVEEKNKRQDAEREGINKNKNTGRKGKKEKRAREEGRRRGHKNFTYFQTAADIDVF